MSEPRPVVFLLRLVPVRDRNGVPVINRLRKFLKMALRAYKLKCIDIWDEVANVEVPQDDSEEESE